MPAIPSLDFYNKRSITANNPVIFLIRLLTLATFSSIEASLFFILVSIAKEFLLVSNDYRLSSFFSIAIILSKRDYIINLISRLSNHKLGEFTTI
jgi:hypothetical protein